MIPCELSTVQPVLLSCANVFSAVEVVVGDRDVFLLLCLDAHGPLLIWRLVVVSNPTRAWSALFPGLLFRLIGTRGRRDAGESCFFLVLPAEAPFVCINHLAGRVWCSADAR